MLHLYVINYLKFLAKLFPIGGVDPVFLDSSIIDICVANNFFK